MGKVLEFKKTVYELCHDNPEAVEILRDLGFEHIANQTMLNTAGRFMTLPQGAEMKKISLAQIKQAFQQKGYQIKD